MSMNGAFGPVLIPAFTARGHSEKRANPQSSVVRQISDLRRRIPE
jgi:hypothetical protein